MAVLEGGYIDPRWMFAEDLEATIRAARELGRRWPYVATGEQRAHPQYDVTGAVHRLERGQP